MPTLMKPPGTQNLCLEALGKTNSAFLYTFGYGPVEPRPSWAGIWCRPGKAGNVAPKNLRGPFQRSPWTSRPAKAYPMPVTKFYTGGPDPTRPRSTKLKFKDKLC